MRLLGDRVLQDVAWKIAAELGGPETFGAESISLTRLQADALVTGDPQLRQAASQNRCRRGGLRRRFDQRLT